MDRLKEKWGPLPIWAWALIGLAALLALWWINKQGLFSSGGSSSGGGSAANLGNQGPPAPALPDLTGALAGMGGNPQPPQRGGPAGQPVTQAMPGSRQTNPSTASWGVTVYPGGALNSVSPVATAPVVGAR